jgi:hypothetical protein
MSRPASTYKPNVAAGFTSASSGFHRASNIITVDYAFRPVNLPVGGSCWVYGISNTGFQFWATGLALGDHYAVQVTDQWPVGDVGRGQIQLRDSTGELVYTYGWQTILAA